MREGHGLGINTVDGEGHSLDSSGDDVMVKTDIAGVVQKQIRRNDWNVVNP